MSSNVRTPWLLVPLLAMATLAACSKDDGGNSPPTISNFQMYPTEALLNQGGGTIIIHGSFDFSDPDGDLATFHITSSAGDHAELPIQGAAGWTSGTIEGAFEVSTTTLGHFTFEIYVTDGRGNRSNALSGTFDVRPDDTAATWTQRSFPVPPGSTDFRLGRVRWVNGRFLAVGSGMIASPDGITWTEVATGPVDDVTWTGTQFVAVHYPSALTSPDGVTWTPHTLPVVDQGALAGVAASGTTIVAVGSRRYLATPDPGTLILTSPDGASWSEVPTILGGELKAVTWSGSRFVAVGWLSGPLSQALVLTSADGVTWADQTIPSLSFLQDVTWSGSRFVAAGYPGLATSTDGLTWQRTGEGVSGPANAVAWSGRRFLACGVTYCASSMDGLQWVTVMGPSVNPSGPSVTLNGLAWGANRWAGVGTDGFAAYLFTSP